jgi:hypothetical protein
MQALLWCHIPYDSSPLIWSQTGKPSTTRFRSKTTKSCTSTKHKCKIHNVNSCVASSLAQKSLVSIMFPPLDYLSNWLSCPTLTLLTLSSSTSHMYYSCGVAHGLAQPSLFAHGFPSLLVHPSMPLVHLNEICMTFTTC